mmetsp:Transcript_22311/g.53063  ORF Transcript_22311/g.53063 Transcript_22311/m.53063 type:complete len:277 (-) Transcript_22311:249-1079(-)
MRDTNLSHFYKTTSNVDTISSKSVSSTNIPSSIVMTPHIDPFQNDPPALIVRKPSTIGVEKEVETREAVYQELQLTKSKAEKIDSMVDREVQLRLELALLEADATAKKLAADEALRNAMNALNAIESADDEGDTPDIKEEMATVAAARSINGTIDAVAKLMKEANADEPDETLAEGREGPTSPPTIVRRTEFEEEADVHGLQVATSNLSNDAQQTITHEERMENTLDVIMFKIEECTAIISDPNSSVEDQMSAAKLVSQYARAATAFQTAAYAKEN